MLQIEMYRVEWTQSYVRVISIPFVAFLYVVDALINTNPVVKNPGPGELQAFVPAQH